MVIFLALKVYFAYLGLIGVYKPNKIGFGGILNTLSSVVLFFYLLGEPIMALIGLFCLLDMIFPTVNYRVYYLLNLIKWLVVIKILSLNY